MSKTIRYVLCCALSLSLACSGDDTGADHGGAGQGADHDASTAGAAGVGGSAADDGAGQVASTNDAAVVDAAEEHAADGGSDAGVSQGPRPHPLYRRFDLDSLPGPGGAASGAYEPPALPETTRTVMVTSTGAQARTDLLAACQTAGTAVIVSNAAGNIGTLDLGNVTDCDVTLGTLVVVELVYVGHLPGPQVAPAHRLRIRGGQLGHIMVDPGSTDIVFDGVTLNNAVVPPAQRSSTGIYLMDNAGEVVNRFAFVNSIIRMQPTPPDGSGISDGCAYLASKARNVFFANDNVVTAGNRNSWGFRLSGGDNFIIVDCTVRVQFHKLIRMNDAAVDYVYVKGGTWMRDDGLSATGDVLNDAFAQIGDDGTDHVYIHDLDAYFMLNEPLQLGPSNGPGQVGKSWELRGITWHAPSANVISDESLTQRQQSCAVGASCDFGVGTHTYDYDANLELPTNAWRALPGITEDNPDSLPIAP